MVMINIDFLTLKAFFTENSDFIINSRIQKIQQPTRRDFVFTLRNNGEGRKLYININPQIYHIAFMSMQNEKLRNIKIPKQPPMFCMLLRKYLEGARIIDARAVENERILELYFEIFDELGEKCLLTLAIELMGKHSNVILYNSENFVIIGCAHNVGSEKSRYRELQGGLKYIYPPKSEVHFSNELKKQFDGLNQEKVSQYLNSEIFHPAIAGERYTLFGELIKNSVQRDSVNQMLDDYYAFFQSKFNIQNEKNKLLEILNIKLKKNTNTISKISSLLNKRDNIEKYKLYGDLLTANLYKKADFCTSIEIYDYTNNKNIQIDLDSTKTMSENAQNYYKLYSKSKVTKEKSQEMLSSLKIEKEYLENILYSINSAQNINDIEEIKTEIFTEYKTNSTKKNTKIDIMKLNIKGFDIYIGKNNKQNDYIVSKLAKDNDLWFHTHSCAGSHVLLKVAENEPTEDIIFECCKLARKYSSASLPSKVGVIYTKAKNLRKPPAAPLGYVTYKNEKEILV